MGRFVANAIVCAVTTWQEGAGAQTPAREQYIDLELAELLEAEGKSVDGRGR